HLDEVGLVGVGHRRTGGLDQHARFAGAHRSVPLGQDHQVPAWLPDQAGERDQLLQACGRGSHRVARFVEGEKTTAEAASSLRWRWAWTAVGKRPSATAWMAILPMLDASIGPATTGRPLRSAVSWHNSSLRDPPPTIRIRSTSAPARSAASVMVST